MAPAVTLDNISLSYGDKQVLRTVSLQIRAGVFFTLIGPNGSGKTTLLRVIAGLQRTAAGTVAIAGRPLSGYGRKELARVIAVVPQHFPVDFPFTVEETVLMGRTPHMGLAAIEKKIDFDLARQAMEFTDVVHLANRRLDQLSGGERQRVVIARAICQQPRIILLDEPTAALDPAHQMKIMDLMERLRQERQTTIVMVTHDLNLAALYGGQVLLIREGGIVCSGTPAEVLQKDLLEDVYGCCMQVDINPLGGMPRVMPVPEKYMEPVRGEE